MNGQGIFILFSLLYTEISLNLYIIPTGYLLLIIKIKISTTPINNHLRVRLSVRPKNIIKLVWFCLLMFKCCSLWHVEMMRWSFFGHQIVRSCLKLFSEMNSQIVVFLGHSMALFFLILNLCLLGTGWIRLQSYIFWHALVITQFVHTGN